MLEFCRINNARMVFLSTSGVYRPKSDSVKESDDLAPRSSYAMSKLMGEQLCARYNEDFKVPVTVLRLFNPYGPGQQGRFIVSYIFQCLTRNERPSLRTPNSRRDFIYIDDVCDAIYKTLGLEFPGFDIINIGSGVPVSIVEVVDKIYALYGRQRPLEVQSGAAMDDKIPFICADVGKAGECLSWKSETPLEKGLENILRHSNRQG
jgi:UDP-glucose 4-epimerase